MNNLIGLYDRAVKERHRQDTSENFVHIYNNPSFHLGHLLEPTS